MQLASGWERLVRLIATGVALPECTVGDYPRSLPNRLDRSAPEWWLLACARSHAILCPLPEWCAIHWDFQRNEVTPQRQ